MDGAYAESSVKAKVPGKYILFKALMIIGCIALFMLLPLIGFIAVFLSIAGVVATIMAFPYLSNLEYEVIYVNGQFDFARILNGSNRKRLLRMDLDSAEILAPENSAEINSYKNNSAYKVKSFASGNEHTKTYAIAGRDSDGHSCVAIFEPTEKMLGLVKSNPTYRRKFKEY